MLIKLVPVVEGETVLDQLIFSMGCFCCLQSPISMSLSCPLQSRKDSQSSIKIELAEGSWRSGLVKQIVEEQIEPQYLSY